MWFVAKIARAWLISTCVHTVWTASFIAPNFPNKAARCVERTVFSMKAAVTSDCKLAGRENPSVRRIKANVLVSRISFAICHLPDRYQGCHTTLINLAAVFVASSLNASYWEKCF